jgi:hypothetical protein
VALVAHRARIDAVGGVEWQRGEKDGKGGRHWLQRVGCDWCDGRRICVRAVGMRWGLWLWSWLWLWLAKSGGRASAIHGKWRPQRRVAASRAVDCEFDRTSGVR